MLLTIGVGIVGDGEHQSKLITSDINLIDNGGCGP